MQGSQGSRPRASIGDREEPERDGIVMVMVIVACVLWNRPVPATRRVWDEVGGACYGATMPIDPQRFRDPPPRYRAPEVWQQAGLDEDFARRLFRALGLPEVDDDEVDFSERDLEVATTIRMLLDQGYPEEEIVTVARTYGYSLSRIAFAQVRLFRRAFIDPLIEAGHSDEQIVAEMDKVVPSLLELLDVQLETIHRRHLAIALQQVAPAGGAATETLAAGFADLVNFSRLSNDLEGDDLEELVTRFETLVVERCVDAGAEVVKVLGDAVMFVASDPSAALNAAMGVVQGTKADPDLPDARAGLDHGEVRPLGGDYFGRPINVASRLTGFARPGTVVVSEAMLDALPETYDVSHIGKARLKGVGTIRAFKVRPEGREG